MNAAANAPGGAGAVALRDLDLFCGLAPEQLAGLEPLLRRRRVAAGVTLFTAGQPGNVAYIVLEGTLEVHVDEADGSEVVVALRGPGEIVGEMSLVDNLARSATVVTKEAATLLRIERTHFWEMLRTIPVIAHNLSAILSRRLRLATAQIQALVTLDVEGRVARQLLVFANEYGVPAPNGDLVIPIRLTQNDLAGLVGASRVRVNQAMVAYKRSGAISVDRNRRITIHDRAVLLKRCE